MYSLHQSRIPGKPRVGSETPFLKLHVISMFVVLRFFESKGVEAVLSKWFSSSAPIPYMHQRAQSNTVNAISLPNGAARGACRLRMGGSSFRPR